MPRKNPASTTAASIQPAFATVRQAGEFLNVSRATVYVLMNTGELSWAKFGGARRVPWDALREYAQRCTVAAS